MAPLRGSANVGMGRTTNGRTHAPAAGGISTKTAPKHRNKLPEYHGPVPKGDGRNLRGFPTIMRDDEVW